MNKMKKSIILLMIITVVMSIALSLVGCTKAIESKTEEPVVESIEDKEKEVKTTEKETEKETDPSEEKKEETEAAEDKDDAKTVDSKKVVAIGSSLTEMWHLAGGSIAGTTEDSFEEFPEFITDEVTSVGTVKTPAVETILSLEPELVILSADLSGHVEMEEVLTKAGIETYYAQIKNFGDYLEALKDFCEKTGRDDLYQKNGADIETEIKKMKEEFQIADPALTYLLLRMHSSGGKVVAKDQIAADILTDLGAVNIAADNSSLLDDLSLEAILESDPDYIFVVSMGEEEAAMKTLDEMFASQEAWQTLTAVKDDRVIQLPKKLFHNKPNAQWGEAYKHAIELLSAEK